MRIGVLGCGGRMGRAVIETVLEEPGLELAGGIEAAGSPVLGQDLARLVGREPIGRLAGDDPTDLFGSSDVVIEFSTAEATARHAELAAAAGVAHVIGTTAFSDDHDRRVRAAAERVPILRAANMSLGVNLLLGLAEQVARALPAEAFDAEIVEIHHRHKIDAPSGTALALGDAVARGRAVDLGRVAERGRDGLTGARTTGAIGFAALRGGDAVGDHTVIFAGAGERIELTHRASDRRIYARGAVRAARWVAGRPAGLYGMNDVLGLNLSGPAT
ncbi:MAG: 4-hydroxy-tetrahydrodipicolinate reductase [Geminicoccaceae bacterium]|nr:4-hydroxy-tetrahydrodipicolinate reductase [Geminicoccaceae bacterium]